MKSLEAFASMWPLDLERLIEVTERFPFKMNGYFQGLIRFPGDPIWRQAIPDVAELADPAGYEDPLAEERLSPVPNLVHRYPNRVLWLVSDQCAVHCRFCTRKRRWQKPIPMTEETFHAALDYIRRRPAINDVLLSGGDPLLLPHGKLESILNGLRKITHVDIIRIGTRVPCVFPEGVTAHLADMLARYHPLYVNIHFNHPLEITTESTTACTLLANVGIPLGSQTVLLRGINDQSDILAELFQKLLKMRVRPYYLMQMDLTQGTSHFRTSLSTGLKIVKSLRNRISGMAIPHFVVDLPGGGGKVPLVPSRIVDLEGNELIMRDMRGDLCRYPLTSREDEELEDLLFRKGSDF